MRFVRTRLCARGPAPRLRPQSCFRPEVPPRLPDPGIYSQERRFDAGEAFEFANPDISKFANLVPGHDNDTEVTRFGVRVSVTNFSEDAPAAGVQVHVTSTRWGIGFVPQPVGAFVVNLGIASSPNARMTSEINMDAEDIFSVFHVGVFHPKDRDFANNRGTDAQRRENIPDGPFSMPFTVNNPLQRNATIAVGVNNTTWGAAVNPGVLDLMPGQNAVATLSGTADLTGMTPSDRMDFTIIATVDGALLGGLTYRLGPANT